MYTCVDRRIGGLIYPRARNAHCKCSRLVVFFETAEKSGHVFSLLVVPTMGAKSVLRCLFRDFILSIRPCQNKIQMRTFLIGF